MSRRKREDHPAAWHHVFNRGIAKRALFERSDDIERFLELLAQTVAAGLIEVHAYCLLSTHFHLLVRSVTGDISKAVHLIQNTYSRTFNRSRRRDGPLVRGRFGSRLVEDSAYWETVVRYIDLNPVAAGLCALPSDYPHGSAAAYRWGEGPEWLSRSLIEAVVVEALNTKSFERETYDGWALSSSAESVAAIIEAVGDRGRGPMRYDDLIRCASLRQQAWMAFKARLADGTRLGTVLLAPATVIDLVARRRRRRPALKTSPRAGAGSFWDVLESGLLRDFCGLELLRIGERLGLTTSTVHHRSGVHARLLATEERYRRLVARVVRAALARDLPPPRRALGTIGIRCQVSSCNRRGEPGRGRRDFDGWKN
jgi:REP element-mobilizing transposase RayT